MDISGLAFTKTYVSYFIFDLGGLTVSNSNFSGAEIGIHCENFTGQLAVSNSTFSNNTEGIETSCPGTVSNSTFDAQLSGWHRH